LNHNGHPTNGALVGVGLLQASCDNLTSKANIAYKFQNTKNFIFLINLHNLKLAKSLEFVLSIYGQLVPHVWLMINISKSINSHSPLINFCLFSYEFEFFFIALLNGLFLSSTFLNFHSLFDSYLFQVFEYPSSLRSFDNLNGIVDHNFLRISFGSFIFIQLFSSL
jgi:hypothetical protein